MELWIKSQKNDESGIVQRLIKPNDIYLDYCGENDSYYISVNNGIEVAYYNSEERALEVLYEIESIMKTNCGFELYSRTGVYPDEFNKKWDCVPVYQMPRK